MLKKGAKVWCFIVILVFLFAIHSLCFVIMAGGVGVDDCLFEDQNIGKVEDLHSKSYQPKGTNSKIITLLSTFEKGNIIEARSSLEVCDIPGGDVLIRKSKGDKGIILRGPEKSYGINWWCIRWEKESREGWSKENQLRKNDFNPSRKFSRDDPVEVCGTKGLGLYVRTDPPDLAWKRGVGEGAKGTIIGGPVYGIPKDHIPEEKKILYLFWKVKFGSITGWCAEGWPYPEGVDYLKKVESPGIRFLIEEERIVEKDIKVTVGGDKYIIATLEHKIDPEELRILPDSGETKIYLDLDGNPVSDGEIARRIGLIDFVVEEVKEIDPGEKIRELEQLQLEFSDFNLKDMTLGGINLVLTAGVDIDKVVAEMAVIKSAGTALTNLEKIKDLAKTQPTGIPIKIITTIMRKMIWDPMSDAKSDLENELHMAIAYYESTEIILNQNSNEFKDYQAAQSFLWNYLNGKAYEERANYLFEKIFGNWVRVAIKLDFISGSLTYGLSDFPKLIWEAKECLDWTSDIAIKRIIKDYEIQAIVSFKLLKAAPYTLDLSQSSSKVSKYDLKYDECINDGHKEAEKLAIDLTDYLSGFEINKYFGFIKQMRIFSPGEVRVYDSQGKITGIVNGKIKEEIPNSIYDETGIVIIFFSTDSYRYEVIGTDTGTYGLAISSLEDGEATTFTATDIPTTPGAIHQYTIDWDALSQGEKGVTVKMDSNGNGTFEHPIITNNSFHPLIAQFTVSPENPRIGDKVTLDASTSFDLGGGVIKQYRWEFYNAANQDLFHVIEGHDKEIIRYTFTSEGIYRVRLTVTDDEGAYSYTESSISIKESITEPVFYVPDDYPSIQAAVDAANAGDTIIVRDGTYTENVDIDKSITLKSSSGNQGNTIVQAANPNDHIFEITADYVNISGFTVGGVAVCIFLNEVNYCNISNNHILNYTGIYLNYSNDNIIMNNNFSKSDDGILLDSSNSNTVFNNTFFGYNLYSYGICLMNSTNNLISDNTICNCPHGGIELGLVSSNNIILNNTFKNCGLCVWPYEKNTVEGNIFNDKPLIYLENVSQIEVNNAGQVILVNCEYIKVIGCNLSNASIGIDLLNSSNCVIENNICRDNFCGGIDLHDYSSNNIVLNNIIENNFWGIFLTSYASNNIIVNNICENNYIGIHLRDTNNNRIYLNNLNNDCNVQSYNSCNIWNSKEKITYSYNGKSHTNYLGNYWSDYTGTDANNNGIGDSPYGIDDCGGDIDQDYYPLMTWSDHYFNSLPHPLPLPPPTSTLTPSPRPTLTLAPRPTLTLAPRPTLTLAPRPTLTPTPRPTLRPTATLFEKIEGLIAAIRVGVGI